MLANNEGLMRTESRCLQKDLSATLQVILEHQPPYFPCLTAQCQGVPPHTRQEAALRVFPTNWLRVFRHGRTHQGLAAHAPDDALALLETTVAFRFDQSLVELFRRALGAVV